jgi:putative endonuclease
MTSKASSFESLTLRHRKTLQMQGFFYDLMLLLFRSKLQRLNPFFMKYYVYILFSESHQRFYIGQTNGIEQRLQRHNGGYEKATSPYKPWKLILFLEKSTRAEAMVLEKKLKNLNTEDLKKFISKYSH